MRAPSPSADLLRELRDTLLEAVGTIRIWHGMGHANEPEVWALYQQSPEMQRIGDAIARADAHLEGREPQNYSAAQVAVLQEAAGRVLYACEGADDDGDLTERVTLEMLDTLRQALAALRRYPEPPKEDGRG